jgi:hypothetical protein
MFCSICGREFEIDDKHRHHLTQKVYDQHGNWHWDTLIHFWYCSETCFNQDSLWPNYERLWIEEQIKQKFITEKVIPFFYERINGKWKVKRED